VKTPAPPGNAPRFTPSYRSSNQARP